MKRKLCRMSRGRNASARSRTRSSGQIYRAATIPHAMKLNAILTKNQIICCGTMNISFLEFQPLTRSSLFKRGESLLRSCADQYPERHQGPDGNVLVIHQLFFRE